MTKSPIVLDDVNILKRIKNAEVGLSITTSDDKLSRFLEVQAPSASARIRTVKKLNDAGIKTYVFIGPFLPHMKYEPELLEKLFTELAATGTKDVKVEYLNLPKYVRPRLNKVLKEEPAEFGKYIQHHSMKRIEKRWNRLFEPYWKSMNSI